MLLAGRYRLAEPVASGAGGTYWHATDEKLARSVGVLLLDRGHPQAERVLEAARASAETGDPRLLRVLDAAVSGGRTYVVSAWVRGVDLATLASSAPLDPRDAVELVREAAAGLATAHAAGLSHQRLTPRALLRGEDGQAIVVGVGLDVALRGGGADDPVEAARLDARGLGGLLFAALTGRWPQAALEREGARSDAAPGLAPSPVAGPEDASPARLVPGLGPDLDALVRRALGEQVRPHLPAFTHPAEIAEELAHARVVLHQSADVLPARPRASRREVGRTVGVAAAWIAGLVALGWIGWTLATSGLPTLGADAGPKQIPAGLTAPVVRAPAPTAPAGGGPAPAARPAGSIVPIVAAQDLDPEGDGKENPQETGLAYDGSTATAWRTGGYKNRPNFGGLKKGVGLRLDLGAPQDIASVTVTLLGSPSDLELRVGNDDAPQAEGYAVAARADQAGTEVALVPDAPVQARYVLLWFTSLPKEAGSSLYRGGVAEVTVRQP